MVIKLENASFAYDGAVVVRGINFTLEQGDYLCVVGENGSGKSTLIKGLLGLKPPAHGSVTFGKGINPRQIGYMPQQTPAQRDFPAGVSEVVISGRLAKRGFKPFYGKADRYAADMNMEKLGIADLRKHCYGELSGGQQQRVLLARALCAAEKLLLLDEPAAGLDPIITAELYGVIERLNRNSDSGGMTVIMVSHDINAAARHEGKILHLSPHRCSLDEVQKCECDPNSITESQLFFGTSDEYRRTEAGARFLGGQRAY